MLISNICSCMHCVINYISLNANLQLSEVNLSKVKISPEFYMKRLSGSTKKGDKLSLLTNNLQL